MPRLKVTARSNSPFGDIDDAQHKFVIKVGTGLKGEKGDRGDTGLINGATQVQVHSTTKVMYNGSSIPANTAASRTVGASNGNVATYHGVNGLSSFGYGGGFSVTKEWADIIPETGFYRSIDSSSAQSPHKSWSTRLVHKFNDTSGFEISGSIHFPALAVRSMRDNIFAEWAIVYSTYNTTIEDGTNYLKIASPILRLQHNSFVKEHEAEKMDIVVDNPSAGVYKISGTTGLRNDGTWYFSPPKDEHNNVLCMVEVSEENEVITVNTYKKKFDFETVSIVPDYEQPTDIPEGATVMLRFNDLPAEPMPPEV